LLDGAGVVTDTFAYEGFGNLVARTGTTPNQYLYRAEALDAGTGMYCLRARWSRPVVGRFSNKDPLEGQFEEPLSENQFLYAEADPIQKLDPTGEAARIFSTMLRAGQFYIARAGASAAARLATRPIACAVSLLIAFGVCSTIIESLPSSSLKFNGGLPGINVSVAQGYIRPLSEHVEEPITRIAVYSKKALTPEVKAALNDFVRNKPGYEWFHTSITHPHAENASRAAVQAAGRWVSAVTTRWNPCDGAKQNCKAVFGIAGLALRGAGKCIAPHFPIAP
jgi:RHS repeat-associated protein